MAERRSAHRTQWAAQFSVASELCKLGYQVALTMGNHPAVDLMVISPNGEQFSVDVKGLYKKNYWAVGETEERLNLYFIFAFVPDDAQNEFYIADQRTVNRLVRENLARVRETRTKHGKSLEKVERFPGIGWNQLLPFKDAWKKVLPA